jgi:adenylate cyclase
MRCPACDFENPADVRFCGSCGASLTPACPACGAENPAGFRFCGSCGASLVDPGSPSEPAVAPRVGERRRVTVLFADLVGFSTLAEHLDPEELRTLMTDTFSELTEEVEAREGFVEKFIGDAIVAVFGAPVTHEDDPLRAVETGLAMLEIVRRRSEGAPAPLALRIGVNSGLVVAGAVGDGSQTGVMGDAVNIAARLQQTAEPGQVLLAASTWRRVRDRFEAERVGALEVKGKTQPVEAYRLAARREVGLREGSPFVGRSEELALMELLWSSVLKGNTHLVSVVGEPGVGKSRLLAELRPDGADRDLRIVCGGERAFGPFLDLAESLLGGAPADQDELRAKAAFLGVDEEDVLLLAPFFGFGGAPPAVRMADEQRRRQLFAGFWQFLVAACRERPTFVGLDDVHWADESSRALLDFLLERLGGVPLMLVVSYRPGFDQIERAELHASHTAIRLEPLGPEDSVALARGFLGVADLPRDLERLVATRAEGNPFFIEELLQALLELGALAVVDGTAVLARLELEIPDTVQGTILARIDRLDPLARLVLQHAAVLGRGSTTELLEAVLAEGDLAEPLAALARAQLIVTPAPGEWAFKHALIQEVAYETLLLRHRRELHEKAARALEERAGDDPALLEALAEHYALAEAPDKARRYALAAGDLARERMGVAEAKRRYETALRLWGEGDEEGRLELLVKLGNAGMVAGDYATARTAMIEAEAGWRERGDRQRAGGALALLGRILWSEGDSERAFRTYEQAISLLEELGPSAELAEAYTWASSSRMLAGDLVESTELAQRGLALTEQLGLDTFRAHLLNTLGCCEAYAGNPAGIGRLEEALELAKEGGDPHAIPRAYNNLTSVLVDCGECARAVGVGEEGREAARRLGATGFEWYIAGNQANALAFLARFEEAEALTRQILDEQRAVLGPPGLINAGMPRVTVFTRLGKLDEARALLDELMPLARGVGGAEFLAKNLAGEAELEHARGNLAAARQAIQEAVEVGFASPARGQCLALLPEGARLLPPEEVERLLEQFRDVPSFPLADARRSEAGGLAHGNPEHLREAADLYESIGLTYEAARCLIDAGELDRARELVERFGLGEGPLGAALAAAAAPSPAP